MVSSIVLLLNVMGHLYHLRTSLEIHYTKIKEQYDTNQNNCERPNELKKTYYFVVKQQPID